MVNLRDRNRVYIGHLPADVTAEDLISELSKFGRIRDVDVKYGHTRHGTAYAFAEFADSESAEKAVTESEGMTLLGSRIIVEFTSGMQRARTHANEYGQIQDTDDRSSRTSSTLPQRSEYKVIVSGLPRNTSWQDLKDHMRRAGAVGFAVVYDQGVGIVEYRDRESVAEAISTLDNSIIATHFDLSGQIRVCRPEDYAGALPSQTSRKIGNTFSQARKFPQSDSSRSVARFTSDFDGPYSRPRASGRATAADRASQQSTRHLSESDSPK